MFCLKPCIIIPFAKMMSLGYRCFVLKPCIIIPLAKFLSYYTTWFILFYFILFFLLDLGLFLPISFILDKILPFLKGLDTFFIIFGLLVQFLYPSPSLYFISCLSYPMGLLETYVKWKNSIWSVHRWKPNV